MKKLSASWPKYKENRNRKGETGNENTGGYFPSKEFADP